MFEDYIYFVFLTVWTKEKCLVVAPAMYGFFGCQQKNWRRMFGRDFGFLVKAFVEASS